MKINLSNPKQVLRLGIGIAYIVMGVFFIAKLPIPSISETLHYVLGGLCIVYGAFRFWRGLNNEWEQ